MLLALLDVAVPVKVQMLQDLRSEGRNGLLGRKTMTCTRPRQELEALLCQIQPVPVKFYDRWEVLLSSDPGTRRTGSLLHELWRHPPEQLRPMPEGALKLRRFTSLLQETRDPG